MTPNPKHVEILRNVINYSPEQMHFWMTSLEVTLSFTLEQALTAMQVLQDEIDRLEKENKELMEQLKTI